MVWWLRQMKGPDMTSHSSNTVVDTGPIFADGVAAMLPSLIAPTLSEHAARRADVDLARFNSAQLGLRGDAEAYELLPGGVACIRVSGLLLQRPGLLLRILLGASDLVECQRAVAAAGADSSVRSILLAIDSPGGTVNGPPEIAALIEEVGRSKPVLAWSDGMMASAAYWIASACHSIYVSGPTVTTGSIGVVATHRYRPDLDGGVTTEITTGKLKTIGSTSAPLSSEGREHIQSRVDYLGGVFHQAVARGRGLTAAKVASLQAGTFIGAQGMDAGLVDGMVSFGVLVADLAANPARYMRRRQQAPGTAVVRAAATVAPVAAIGSTVAAASTVPSRSAPAVPSSAPAAPSLAEQKSQAAKCLADAYAMHGPSFRVRVQSVDAWQKQAQARAKKDGCDLMTAMKREGFVHALVSFPALQVIATQRSPGAFVPVPRAQEDEHAVLPRYSDSAPFSDADKKAAGRALVLAHAQHGGEFRLKVLASDVWNSVAYYRAQKEGCSFAEALRLEGYVHPCISVALSTR